MKQSDIFSIIIIAAIGVMASYFAVNSFLGNPDEATETIKTITEISPELEKPDPELFNKAALNPTVEVEIDGCKDLDHNGIIDYAEMVACGRATKSTNTKNSDKKDSKESSKEKQSEE
jgi:hypothetical protein